MAKYRSYRNRAQRGFVQRHKPDCLCAGDHCGEIDARRAERRKRDVTIYRDDVRTAQVARSIGLNVRRRAA